MRRVKETVPYPVAKERALAVLPGAGEVKMGRARHMAASAVADAIWPDAKWINAQGAGAAASRILKRMEREGLAYWTSSKHSWGWVAGSKH